MPSSRRRMRDGRRGFVPRQGDCRAAADKSPTAAPGPRHARAPGLTGGAWQFDRVSPRHLANMPESAAVAIDRQAW
jgi:hypothetical protein